MSAALERQVQQLLNRIRQLEDDRTPPQVESWTEGESSSVTYAYPPSTGIPAATYDAETQKTTLGVATCKIAVEDSPGVFKPGTESVIVENQVGSAIGTTGKMMTIALNNTSGRWEVIVEDCTSGSGGGGPDTNPDNPTPEPPLDPINTGTSKSVSLNYTMGV